MQKKKAGVKQHPGKKLLAGKTGIVNHAAYKALEITFLAGIVSG
jgi:hypothetical protein